jgi:aminopeptidase
LHSFPASLDRLKGVSRCGARIREPVGRHSSTVLRVQGELLERYAKLVAGVGANVQHGQQVLVIAAPHAAPLVRAVAAECYARGAVFVDPWYFDPDVKRIRAREADVDTLEFVPSWYPKRLLELGAAHGSRISISPNVPPGLLDGIDPAVAGRDQLPSLKEHFDVINAKTTNWSVVPWPTEAWATVAHPELEPADALAKLEEEVVYVLRLDKDDAAAAWRERGGQLKEVGKRLTDHHFDALRFEGPGTELTIGLLPTSRFTGGGSTTVDGIDHMSNLPTEEVFTSPDPTRTEGVVSATKPLDVSGTVVDGLRIRFEGGRVVSIDAESGADVLRARCSKDEGASRLGEVALVDREGRIGKTGTVFFNTLLDENAASHLALGNAYATAVGDGDRDRINTSTIHIDFMIGADDVAVTGLAAEGGEVPVLRGGRWQI